VSSTPPVVGFDARLVPVPDPLDPAENTWTITHGLGKPAAGTYTEVTIGVPEDEDGAPLPERTVEQVVREVAQQLYGTAWAFVYGPSEYADAIKRHELRRRERVIVTDVQVWAP